MVLLILTHEAKIKIFQHVSNIWNLVQNFLVYFYMKPSAKNFSLVLRVRPSIVSVLLQPLGKATESPLDSELSIVCAVDRTVSSLIDEIFQLLELTADQDQTYVLKLCDSEECLRK